jgi:hypothetical protein
MSVRHRGEYKQVLIRLPVSLVDHMDRAAVASLRSRTAEIELRLRESMENESFDAHGCIVQRSPSPVHALADKSRGGQ